MSHVFIKIVAACAAFVMAAPTLADEPGPGGSKLAPPKTGEETYRMICQSCHMPDGKGAASASAGYPSLANNPRLAAAPYPIITVLRGKGAMPWFADTLTPAQTADVVGYIRTHFGNSFTAPVTPEMVSALAGKPPTPEH
jgi:mono/diheme cytochrome c family protein